LNICGVIGYNRRNTHRGGTSLFSGKEWTVRVSVRAIAAIAVVVLVSRFVVADEKADPKQSDQKQLTSAKAEGKSDAKGDAQTAGQSDARAVRLTKPWKDLASLTEEQKRKINEIHRKSTQEVKAIEQREHDDIMALLNEQQKSELTAMLEKEAAEKKAKSADKSKPGTKVSPKEPGKDSAPLAR